uniref:Uncharacterized protein n=1 Tax=Denticeps clupeoides TaxID=299321 RepID=A0AAY4AFW7_9TELE
TPGLCPVQYADPSNGCGRGAGLTSRCSRVKTMGSDTKTRLDSLLMEAERMCELTVSVRFWPPTSVLSFMVAFSTVRNWPRCL